MAKLTEVVQTTVAECGLASLAMVAAYWGRYTTMTELRTELVSGRDGVSMLQLAAWARGRGFHATGYAVSSVDELRELQLPLIAAWGDGHFVVLERINGNRVCYVDPVRGRSTVDMDEASKHFRGVVLSVTPGADFRKKRRPFGDTLRFLTQYLPSQKWMLPSLVGLQILLLAFGFVSPRLSTYVLDNLVLQSDPSPLVSRVGSC